MGDLYTDSDMIRMLISYLRVFVTGIYYSTIKQGMFLMFHQLYHLNKFPTGAIGTRDQLIYNKELTKCR